MAVNKEDLKELGLTLAYDFILVALIVCWALAIAFVILESAFWLVILFFVLGAGFFFMTVYLFKDEQEESEKTSEDETEKEETVAIEEVSV
ncbi:MAG: SND2/TMEM208 family protein [Candidatus Heimdallarchaeota archaeon]